MLVFPQIHCIGASGPALYNPIMQPVPAVQQHFSPPPPNAPRKAEGTANVYMAAPMPALAHLVGAAIPGGAVGSADGENRSGSRCCRSDQHETVRFEVELADLKAAVSKAQE